MGRGTITTENRAVLKIIADKDRIYNELDRTYKKLGAKHIVVVKKLTALTERYNELKRILQEAEDLKIIHAERFVDLKILCGNYKTENKRLKKLLEERKE